MLRFASLKVVVNAIVAILQQNLPVPVLELTRGQAALSHYSQADRLGDCDRRFQI